MTIDELVNHCLDAPSAEACRHDMYQVAPQDWPQFAKRWREQAAAYEEQAGLRKQRVDAHGDSTATPAPWQMLALMQAKNEVFEAEHRRRAT